MFDLSPETITFLAIPRKLVILIVEALPLVLSVAEVAEAILLVQLFDLLQSLAKFFKVVSRDAGNLTSVDEDKELRLDSSIEEALNFGCSIAVNPNVVELSIGRG